MVVTGRGRILGMILVALCLVSCGYSLQHRLRPEFARAADGLFVPVFDNHTDEVGAERVFTNALVREIQSRRQIQVVDRRNASHVLLGELLGVDYMPTSYTRTGFEGLQTYRRLPTELEVRVTVRLKLNRKDTSGPVWEKTFAATRRVETQVERTQSFQSVSSWGLFTQSVIDSSFPDIAGIVMRDVYDEMLEVF